MDRNLATRLTLILVVLGVCIWLLIPTYRYFSTYRNLSEEEVAQLDDGELRDMREVVSKSMKLGLDLQGGMHLVLELDKEGMSSDNQSDAQDRVMQILQTRVNQFGVAEPTIAKQGESRILVQLPGVEDPERAKSLVQELAQLEFRMVAPPQVLQELLIEIDAALAGEEIDADTTSASDPDTGSAGADTSSTGDPQVASDDTALADSILFPELATPAPQTEVSGDASRQFSQNFIDILPGTGGALIMVDDPVRIRRVNAILERPEVRKLIERKKVRFFWSSEDFGRTQDGLPTKILYLMNDKVELTGGSLKDARIGPDPNNPAAMVVNFRLDRKGARTFSNLTGENVGKRMAIVLDDVVKSAPSINGRIPSGEGQIIGSFTDVEAKDLAIVLRAGALPVDLNVVEERTVGPTLGADSLNKGLTAALVGLGLTAVFLLIYYQFAGLLATLALVMNMMIVLAAMATLRAALSLPGIAGLVLSIAMAVDANVLIFERIREELRKDKTVNASIDAGYKNALSAIIDSNLTTIFAGIVLLYFGTGPIKGFAVTLCIGILASMFTALFMTRFFFDSLTRRRRLQKLSI